MACLMLIEMLEFGCHGMEGNVGKSFMTCISHNALVQPVDKPKQPIVELCARSGRSLVKCVQWAVTCSDQF